MTGSPSDPGRLFDTDPFSVVEDPAGARPRATASSAADGGGLEPGERIVRVLPDVSGLDKEFDYRCPARWADEIDVGSLVRIDLNRRRVAGWVTAVDVEPDAPGNLLTLSKVSSVGPPAEVVELARWAAWRWRGRLAPILKSASPHRMVRVKPAPRAVSSAGRGGSEAAKGDDWLTGSVLDTLAQTGPDQPVCVETSPLDDPRPLIAALAAERNVLVVLPDLARSRRLVGWLGHRGVRAHLHPGQWAAGFTGGVMVGTRSAIWAPVTDLGAIVVIDEHDEPLQEERVPTWHARDVAVERARRAGARCVLLSPTPSLSASWGSGSVVRAPRSVQRHGWPVVEVIDRRDDDLGFTNLFSQRLVEVVRKADSAVLILNRKGRARLLACRTCGELVRTEDGANLMVEDDDGLIAPETGETRPMVCAVCTGTVLKRLQLGVGRAAEELSRLLGRPITEITAEQPGQDRSPVAGSIVLGTEAALRAVDRCDVVAFLDFDQELLAPRFRAAEQAFVLLGMAARRIGGRQDGRRLLIQTRLPDHRSIRAAVSGNPQLLAEAELPLRASLNLPPFGAVAEVSGAGADAFARAVGQLVADEPEDRPGVTVLGPRRDGRYLISVGAPPPAADDNSDVAVAPADALASLLESAPRPKDRVRIAVDPPRV